MLTFRWEIYISFISKLVVVCSCFLSSGTFSVFVANSYLLTKESWLPLFFLTNFEGSSAPPSLTSNFLLRRLSIFLCLSPSKVPPPIFPFFPPPPQAGLSDSRFSDVLHAATTPVSFSFSTWLTSCLFFYQFVSTTDLSFRSMPEFTTPFRFLFHHFSGGLYTPPHRGAVSPKPVYFFLSPRARCFSFFSFSPLTTRLTPPGRDDVFHEHVVAF